MSFIYTDEHVDYIKKIAPGRYNDEITEKFNGKFNLNKSAGAINSMKKNHGITSGELPSRLNYKNRLFNKEQERFLFENAKGLYNEELTDLVNNEFGLKVSASQIKSWKKRNKVKSGITGHFEKGQDAWNKGLKGLNTGGEAGWFKKGQVPSNYRPIGSERIASKDGYIMVKVQDGGACPERWRHKHVVVWEKTHGKVTEEHVVAFLDSDRSNVTIKNLTLLTRGELAQMNKNNLFSSDPDITKVGINLVRLNKKVNELSFYGLDDKDFQKCVEAAAKRGISKKTFMARLRRGWNLEDSVYSSLGTKRNRH